MKRLLIVFLALALNVVMMVPSSSLAQEVGVAWVGSSGMAKRVLKGLETGIKDLAPGVKLEVHPELANMESLAELVSKFEKSKAAMVILRSNGAEWLGENPPTIPTFIGGCNNPVQLGAVKNMDAPEGNITGVTYFLPVKTQFEVFKAILPEMKSILLLVEKGHPSSEIDQEGTREVASNLGIEYREKVLSSKDEIIPTIKENAGKVSAFVLGNQALLIDNAADAIPAAGDTPVLSYSSKPVSAGALGGFVADDEKLGLILAESMADVLVNKKAVKEVPVKVDPNPKFFINVKTAEKLKLEIPYSILEIATIIE